MGFSAGRPYHGSAGDPTPAPRTLLKETANTDADERDARFVIDKMGLNYPTLKAMKIPQKYTVSAFPTLLIVDQEGVLRDIHVGYSPTLREEVVRSVENLLKKQR